MYRFVDLNDSYWTNPDGSEDAHCAILDTRTNRFLECDGKHVLGDIDEVRDAAGDRGVGLVPAGFFERKQAGTGQSVERHGVRGVLAALLTREFGHHRLFAQCGVGAFKLVHVLPNLMEPHVGTYRQTHGACALVRVRVELALHQRDESTQADLFVEGHPTIPHRSNRLAPTTASAF